MPVTDLARALPALLLIGVLPGFALATLIVPTWRWWERLAATPGLSAGLAGVIGLVMHDVHVPFTAATVLPVEGLITVAAAWRWKRRRAALATGGGRAQWSRAAAVVVIAGAAAGAVSAASVVVAFHGMPVPLPTDAPVHGVVADAIARAHDALPTIPDPGQSTAWLRPRTGFEAVAALASELGGPAPTWDMLPFATLAVALIPLGLAAFALEVTGSTAIAALAPLLGVGLAFPSVAIYFGEFPYVVDATLVVPVIIAVVRLLRSGRASISNVALLAVATASIWVIHGLEAITAIAVGTPLVLALLLRDRRATALRIPLVAAAAVAGAGLVTMLTRPPSLPAAAPSALAGPVVTEVSRYVSGIGRLSIADASSVFVQFAFPSAIAVLLFILGVVAAVAQRRHRWLIVAHILLLACFVDVLATGRLARLWKVVYPWSSPDRVPAVQYWVVPVLMAVGVVWAAARLEAPLRALLELLHHRGARLGGPTLRAGALGAVGILLVAVDVHHDTRLYASAVRQLGVAGPADMTVMRTMSARLPQGSVILVDAGDDSGQWVSAVTDDIQLLSGDYLKNHPDDLRVVALQGACADPRRAASVLAGVDAVFVGSRRIHDPQHPWSLQCISKVPGLSLLAEAGSSTGTAAAFTVNHEVAEAAASQTGQG